MAQIKPLEDRVLIQRSKAEEKKGGIILPETAQKKPQEGKVLAVGPGKLNENGQREPMNVKVGDTVFFSSYSGTEVKGAKDEELLVLSESDIFGIVA